jgi:pectin methylesterase-like acyl-CoA thioesterase
MRRTTITALLAAAILALAGCSSSDDGKPAKATATVTATKAPSLDAADARQVCVDAWLSVMTTDGYDPDAEPVTPAECEGQSGQAEMYAEALQQRNQANRDEIDECLEDLSCTELPIP